MLAFFLANRWARYAALGVVVALLLLGVRQHYIDLGKEQGKTDQKGSESYQDEKERVTSQKQLADALQASRDALAVANKREDDAKARENTLLATIRSISVQKQTASAQVASLSDTQAHDYNLTLLGGRQDGSCYSGGQERQIAESLTQYPLCKKEVSAKDGSIKAINDRISALNDKITEKDKAFAAMTNAKHESDVRYVKLYNRYPPTYRSAKCLWIAKCGKRNLDLPAPDLIP